VTEPQRARTHAWLPARWASALDRHPSLRFVVAGGLNTLFGFVVYAAIILLGAPTWAALLVGMLAGTVFNFFTIGGYAFRQLSMRRFPLFVACYLCVYAVNLALIGWLAPRAGGPLAGQALALVPMALLSYVLMSRVAFAPSRNEKPR
jgi:putative flippase GtrA